MHFCHVGLSCSLGGGIICTLRAERGDSSSASVLALPCSRGRGGAATHGREAVFTVVFARRLGSMARCRFSYLSQTFGCMAASAACTRLGCATNRPHPGSERPFCLRRRHRVGRCRRSAACAGVCSGICSGICPGVCPGHLSRALVRLLIRSSVPAFVPASVPASVPVFVPATCPTTYPVICSGICAGVCSGICSGICSGVCAGVCPGHLSDYLSGHLFRRLFRCSSLPPVPMQPMGGGGQEKHRRIAGGAQKISGFPDRGSRDLSDR